MFQKTVKDIVAYLDFLRADGYAVSISALDVALEPCLASFILYEAERGVGGIVLPIRHNDRVIVNVHVGGDPLPTQERAHALAAPLCYMFERLFEQCCEYNEHNTVQDAYHKSLIFIRDHYTEGISVADVARGIGYSVSYFGYIFKKNRGISANKYISELQLAKATELLRSTSASVSDIAERVGFGDANYFSTAFKARYGISPRQYRNQNK